MSNERIRFAEATDAYGEWWLRNRRPRGRQRLAMLTREAKARQSV